MGENERRRKKHNRDKKRLTVCAENVMRVPRGAVAIDARVDEEHMTANSCQAAESTEAGRAAADDDGIVVGLRDARRGGRRVGEGGCPGQEGGGEEEEG
jgi:hypothetical protein